MLWFLQSVRIMTGGRRVKDIYAGSVPGSK